MKFVLDNGAWLATADFIPSIPNPVSSSSIDLANKIWPEILQASDWLGLGIIVVCGCLWMFGNRTSAIQRLIDMAIGFEVVRHGLNILGLLRSL